MHITHIHRDGRTTEIATTVDYIPGVGIDRVVSCIAYNNITKDFVDISAFCGEYLGLDSKVDDLTDWYALYHETLNEIE